MTLPASALAEKNKITSNQAFLILVKICYPNEDAVNICLNNIQVVWNSITWQPAAFALSPINETKDGSIPSIPLAFIDPNRDISPLIDKYGGGNGADVWIYMVHSGHLEETTPWSKRLFKIMGAHVDHANKVTLTLSVPNLTLVRDPQDRYFKNHGRNTVKFKDSTCGYTGEETTCNKTLARCRELGNSLRYCGFPGVGRKGFLA
ncbi:MAG: hypothetical protein KJ666_18880 [Bacteroidetes bacterium]|nr:hypothetical protein [Pseudomonadota bacterium]MBU1387087.1 hypothetical protein [Pseudomonadota bacterium]MBU1541596.1 hypothetical protein [Pseudomonadota bacterium]MBU2447621.1 hypothetical protein [Bacteroidota bacterium]MBU2482553.1 hypothetical protein [Pseudomonadota bacterium]